MAATGVSRTESVAETHIVSPSGTSNSILSAIGLANDGDTINTDNGVCKEGILVDEPIRLISTDRLCIGGQGKEPTIQKSRDIQKRRILPVYFLRSDRIGSE